MLSEPAALGKTFEVFSLDGFDKRPIGGALDAIPPDTAAGAAPPDSAAYNVLKQLTPSA